MNDEIDAGKGKLHIRASTGIEKQRSDVLGLTRSSEASIKTPFACGKGLNILTTANSVDADNLSLLCIIWGNSIWPCHGCAWLFLCFSQAILASDT
jgi:hypothetical protein